MITSHIANPAELNLIAHSRLHEWIIDSSTSFHVTSPKDWFENLHKSNNGHVLLRDNLFILLLELVTLP